MKILSEELALEASNQPLSGQSHRPWPESFIKAEVPKRALTVSPISCNIATMARDIKNSIESPASLVCSHKRTTSSV